MAEIRKELIILNSEIDDATLTRPEATGVEIAEQLQKTMLRMTGKFLREDSGTVDYKSLAISPEFRDYCYIALSLKCVELSRFTGKDLMAFFINVYNALTVHSICEIQKDKNISTTLDVPGFWETHAYVISEWTFSLDDIEHGILRGNKPHPTTGNPLFKDEDSRLQFSVTSVDPKIHFALNCGAKSCPMVRVYNSNNIDSGLESATRSYLMQEVHFEEKNGMIRIPQILEWYMEDFATDQHGMLKWIEPYVTPRVQEEIKTLLASGEDVSSKIQYYYDWSLNNSSSVLSTL